MRGPPQPSPVSHPARRTPQRWPGGPPAPAGAGGAGCAPGSRLRAGGQARRGCRSGRRPGRHRTSSTMPTATSRQRTSVAVPACAASPPSARCTCGAQRGTQTGTAQRAKHASLAATSTRWLNVPSAPQRAPRAPSAASTRAALLLVRRSSAWRLRSSTMALMAATPSTNSSDSVGPYGANGLTTAHHARLACARPAAGAAAKLVQVRRRSRAAELETPAHVQHAKLSAALWGLMC